MDFLYFTAFIPFANVYLNKVQLSRSIEMNIYLVRHGETQWVKEGRLQGRTDIPLNEAGRIQLQAVAQYLDCRFSCDIIISSPLQRAYESAQIIASRLNITDIITDAGLIERNYGAAEGTTASERRLPLLPEHYEGIETYDELEKRVLGCIVKNADKYIGKNIIFVTHSASIRTFLKRYIKNNPEAENIKLHPASVSVLKYDGNSFDIVFYNKKVYE